MPSKNPTEKSAWRKMQDSFFWMVLIAFVLRFAYILIAQTYKFKTVDDNFSFGFEMGRIGRSLASGQGFSNPFNGQTGPTAWEPPLYPFIIAAVFKVFGIYSKKSALVLLSINSLFSSLTCIPIFLIARRCFNRIVARWSSWLWAILPPVMFWCTRWVWETSLAALLLATIFWMTLVMEDAGSASIFSGSHPSQRQAKMGHPDSEEDPATTFSGSHPSQRQARMGHPDFLSHRQTTVTHRGLILWLGFGLLWAMAGLTNTSLLAFLPASGLWIWRPRFRHSKKSFSGVVLAATVFVVCVAPWLIRDYQTFGKFIFIRSNFGAELRLGNGPGANGMWMQYLHPSQDASQLRLYRQLGEIAYVTERKRQALAFIREDYGRFFVLCWKRLIYYWTGLPRLSEIPALAPFKNSLFLASSVLGFWGLGRALRKRQPGAWLFFWLILCYPLVFYVVFPHPRYRHPIEPELGILIVYVVSEAESRRKA